MELPMIKRIVCACVVFVGAMAHAQAEQGCPYPSSIKYVEGSFHATVGQAHWQSPQVEYRDFVDRFVGAVFTPGKDQEREDGYLEKCIYRTGAGYVVALWYGAPRQIRSMSLTDTLYWRLASDPFDQDVYICQDSQPDNCSFTVNRPVP